MMGVALGFATMTALLLTATGCGSPMQHEGAKNDTTTARAPVKPPSGVPADAVLVTGAERLKAMLVGKRLQSVHKETEDDQGDDYFHSAVYWEKGCTTEKISCQLGGGKIIAWKNDFYCMEFYGRIRCSQLWRTSEGKLYVKHFYKSGKNTPAYEVAITHMSDETIRLRKWNSK
jgi:hypothetical protein